MMSLFIILISSEFCNVDFLKFQLLNFSIFETLKFPVVQVLKMSVYIRNFCTPILPYSILEFFTVLAFLPSPLLKRRHY